MPRPGWLRRLAPVVGTTCLGSWELGVGSLELGISICNAPQPRSDRPARLREGHAGRAHRPALQRAAHLDRRHPAPGGPRRDAARPRGGGDDRRRGAGQRRADLEPGQGAAVARPIPPAGSSSTAFPARVAQARLLDEMRDPTSIVVHIAVPDEEIIRRLSSRRICESCALTQSVSEATGPGGRLPVLRRHAGAPRRRRRRRPCASG